MRTAILIHPEAARQGPSNLRILAGAGGNWRLAQTVGLPMARRMLYTGESLTAMQAGAAGLVDRVTTPEDVLGTAMELAEQVASQSWRALELTKVALRIHRPATTLYDMTAQALLFDSDDKRQRMSAFLPSAVPAANSGQTGPRRSTNSQSRTIRLDHRTIDSFQD